MLSKIWAIFLRDARVNSRDFLALYLIIVPIVFAVAIQILAPSVNDTSIRLAMLESDDPARIAYLEQFAKVERYADKTTLIQRIEKRDTVVAILPQGDNSDILVQGNEPEGIINYARTLAAFHALNLDIAKTTATFESFGRTEPPLKKMLVITAILFTSMLAGMLIAINIVEEKMDNTVSAINVSPISRMGFILGKSMMGMFLTIYGTIALILITGYTGINVGQLLLGILSISLITLLIGFIQGLSNDDIMEAAAGFKLIMLPLAAGIAVPELLSDKWHIFVYWNPYYWAYKGIGAILSYNATWPQILGYTGIVLLISAVAIIIMTPRIREGLA